MPAAIPVSSRAEGLLLERAQGTVEARGLLGVAMHAARDEQAADHRKSPPLAM